MNRITDPDDPRLGAFYDGIYVAAFPHQAEPIENWRRALRGEASYQIAIVLDEDRGGIVYERYPSAGLMTYLVVAPHARRAGIGRALIDHAVADLGGTVFAEADDPDKHPEPAARARVDRFLRWGANIVPTRYIQPSLGPGLPPDDRLILLYWGEPPSVERVAAFERDLAAGLRSVLA